MAGPERGYDRTHYQSDTARAYERLRSPQIRAFDAMGTLGRTFSDVAHTEAQSGQTAAHVLGLLSMRLVDFREATWAGLVTAELPKAIANKMAAKAIIAHKAHDVIVPDARETDDAAIKVFLSDKSAEIFGFAMDHFFHTVAVLSPEGAEALGTRIDHNQGIAHVTTAPRSREVTLPYIEQYLADQVTFQRVQNLLQASSDALLNAGKPAKKAFADRLAEIAAEHKDDDPNDTELRREKQRKDMQARATMWAATWPIIREGVADVDGFTDQQKEDFAWNSSMVFVTPERDLIPDPHFSQ
jgi:hypothetical protein